MRDDHTRAETINAIADTLRNYDAAAAGGATIEEAARAWVEAGFDDAEEVEDWLHAGCSTPAVARALDDAGLTPEQAALRTKAGLSEEEDTVGHKVTRGDLSLEEARRIANSTFWND